MDSEKTDYFVGRKISKTKNIQGQKKNKTLVTVSTRQSSKEYDLTQSDDETSPQLPPENRNETISGLETSDAAIVEEVESENHPTEDEAIEDHLLFGKYFPIVEGSVPDEKQNVNVICRECSRDKTTTKYMRGSKIATSNLIRHLRVFFKIINSENNW